jgi:ankyrin repeat protein
MTQATKALPARPNLAYLRKLSKLRLRAMRESDPSSRLADAQLAIAREYGFASWRKLRAFVQSARRSDADVSIDLVNQFLDLAVPRPDEDHRGGRLEPAIELLSRHPQLARANIYTAAVVGEHNRIAELLRENRSLANEPGGIRNWPPLCYLAFSRFLRIEKKQRSNEFVKSAKALLDAGADVNSFYMAGNEVETVLYGACGVANDRKLTRLLLDRGAKPVHPPDNESLYHVTEFSDHACLKLILDAAPRDTFFSYCMCHMMDREDPAGLKMFLDRGGDPNILIDRGQPRGWRPLHFAIHRRRSAKIIRILLDYGADPNLANADGTTPYAFAAFLGHADAARELLKHGANDDLPQSGRLLAAIMSGDREAARAMIRDVPDFLKSLSLAHPTLLAYAADSGNLPAVHFLLDLGFDIEAHGDWGTPLHHAAWRGHLAMTRLLIQRGARLDAINHFGGDTLRTAIHGASHAGHTNGPPLVELIARAMPAADLAPYLEYARGHNNSNVIDVLERIATERRDGAAERRAQARKTSRTVQWKPLMDAAFMGDVEKARKLLDAGADPNCISTTAHRYRPLHRAIERKKTMPKHEGHDRVVNLLLERGADPRLRATMGQLTALQLAAVGETRFVPLLLTHFRPLDMFHATVVGDARRVRELLKRNHSLANAKDVNGFTPLHYCAASAMYKQSPDQSRLQIAIAKMLLEAGAKPDATHLWNNEWPIPVLFYCCGHHDNAELAKLLMDAGADPCDGESIYHAADEGHVACLALFEKMIDRRKLANECTGALPNLLHWGRTRGIKWLLAHGADPNFISPLYGNSALQEAARNGAHERVIELLLKHSADPRLKNREGKTAIQLAREAGKNRVVRQLEARL